MAPIQRPARTLRTLLGAAIAVAALGGCAQTVPGTATVDAATAQAVRAELTQKRECESSRDSLTRSLIQALQRADTDFAGGASALNRVMESGAGREMGRACGPELIGDAYSHMLVEVQEAQLTGSPATILRSALMRGMCKTDGRIDLTDAAERACSRAR